MVPIILVQSTTDAEQLCQRNGLTFADLMG
jgi:hypothetical protein